VLPPDEAGLLLGITIGARGVLSPELKEKCIRAGVYHIVVVSGQNISLIVGLGIMLLQGLEVSRRRALWICTLPVLFYTAVVGADPPVLRATVMALVALGCSTLGRDVPRYQPLFLAAGWMVITEPESVLGASFQLSFAATAAILWVFSQQERFSAFRSRWKRFLVQGGVLCLAVHVAIWPLLVMYFKRISLVGLLSNWTILPLADLLMVIGLIVGTWGAFWPGTVPALFLVLARLAARGVLRLIEHLCAWRWAVVEVPALPLWACWLYYGVLFGILFVIHRRETYDQSRPSLSTHRRPL
jgi:competence protein ComEC